MTRRISRRQLLRQTAAAAVGFWVTSGASGDKPRSANGRLNIACIGVGGKGSEDTDHAGQVGHVVALCDIDEQHLDEKSRKFPHALKFVDFREMFAKMGDKIDAVTVSTPDHTHYPASATAIKLGKHVYCQKPLTHSVWEARQLRELARTHGVCTQMGNQGTATDRLRTGVEIIRSGAIGPIREVHVWTNRPIWPQGTEALFQIGPAREAALAALHGQGTTAPRSRPPRHIHWDLFLGPAPERDYASIYHPFNWRGWWDFGTGALGDMGCHTANLPFMALKLGSPTRIAAQSGEINSQTYPTWARITFDFPAREGLPPVKLTWYEGVNAREGRVLPPAALIEGRGYSKSGSLLVGEKGVIYSPNDYGKKYNFLPEKAFAGYKPPAPTLPRNPLGAPILDAEDLAMKKEWAQAVHDNRPETALSNFDYSARLTETILLGNVALRVGKPVEWDGPNLRVANLPEAARYIRMEARKGWAV